MSSIEPQEANANFVQQLPRPIWPMVVDRVAELAGDQSLSVIEISTEYYETVSSDTYPEVLDAFTGVIKEVGTTVGDDKGLRVRSFAICGDRYSDMVNSHEDPTAPGIIGGNEIAIVAGVDGHTAANVAEHIRIRLDALMKRPNIQKLRLSSAIGYATLGKNMKASELVPMADDAVLVDKQRQLGIRPEQLGAIKHVCSRLFREVRVDSPASVLMRYIRYAAHLLQSGDEPGPKPDQ